MDVANILTGLIFPDSQEVKGLPGQGQGSFPEPLMIGGAWGLELIDMRPGGVNGANRVRNKFTPRVEEAQRSPGFHSYWGKGETSPYIGGEGMLDGDGFVGSQALDPIMMDSVFARGGRW